MYPRVNLNVETETIERPDTFGVGAAWSPSGRQIAMTTDVVLGGSWLGGIPLDGTLAIWDLETAKRTLISRAGVNAGTMKDGRTIRAGSYGPIWSDDGQWIAYQRNEDRLQRGSDEEQRQEVWIVRPDGTRPRKVLNHRVDQLAWLPGGRELVWSGRGQFGRVDLEIDPISLGPTPSRREGEYVVFGRVVDAEGKPCVGVDVRVAVGVGTLREGPKAVTDADGRYDLVFRSSGTGQSAVVSAFKPGFFERDLCRAGNLAAVPYKPKHFDRGDWRAVELVIAGIPYELNFTMLPAASAKGVLLDVNGAPLAKYHLSLVGKELYPGTSVFWSGETGVDGSFEIDPVPLKAFQFTVGGRRFEYKSASLKFEQARQIQLRLVYDDIAGTLTVEQEQ
jgi:hypothetical protein